MTAFASYASYYDRLYLDKDYSGEAAFVRTILGRFCPSVDRVLDLGCGTGKHARHLAEHGFSVCGVDASASMVECALSSQSELDRELRQRLSFFQGDVRKVRLKEKFGCVLSLFHVMSYLTANEDLQNAFETIRQHLIPNGICVFDCWYGPAVLNLRPSVRVKELEFEKASILRIAEPTLHPNNNTVDVSYTLWIRNRPENTVEIVRETHRMRYLFLPEVNLLAQQVGLEIVEAREWMTGKEPGLNTWGVYFVART